MRLPKNLIAAYDTLSALRLLLGIVAPTDISLPSLQAITRGISLATVDSTWNSTSLYSFIPSDPPTLPSPSTVKSAIKQLSRSAEQAGKWVDNKQKTLVHDLCYKRPALIHSPRALVVYHRLFQLRLQFCPGQPQFLDSIPRPPWRSRPRRFPPALAIPPPPATRVLHIPTRTQLTSMEGPLPPQPAHPYLRRPPPTSNEQPEPPHNLDPPAWPGNTWIKDVYAFLVVTWLDIQARLLDLTTRLRARVTVRAWLFRLRGWAAHVRALGGSVWVMVPIGLGAFAMVRRRRVGGTRAARAPFKHRPLPSVPSSTHRPPRPPPSPPRPTPPPPTPTSTPRRQIRCVKLSYRLAVWVREGHRTLHRYIGTFDVSGPADQRALLSSQAWVHLQRVVRELELDYRHVAEVRLEVEIDRGVSTWSQLGNSVDAVRTNVQHEMGDRFRSLEEFGATLARRDRTSEWSEELYWSAPDSPTSSRLATPVVEEPKEEPARVRIAGFREVDEEGVDELQWGALRR